MGMRDFDKWTGTCNFDSSGGIHYLVANSVADKTIHTTKTWPAGPRNEGLLIMSRDLGPYQHVGFLVRIKPLTGTSPNFANDMVIAHSGISPDIFDNVWKSGPNQGNVAVHTDNQNRTKEAELVTSQLLQLNSDIGIWWAVTGSVSHAHSSDGIGPLGRIGFHLYLDPTETTAMTADAEFYITYA